MKEPQVFESDWWGDCCSTLGEETKQITYANRMGLVMAPGEGHWPTYDMEGRSILDIGGGPVSMTLKCLNLGKTVVADPLIYEPGLGKKPHYPKWVNDRYKAHGVLPVRWPGEKLEWHFATGKHESFDEVWIYNVLQHVEDPEKLIASATSLGHLVRIFDWLETPPHEGHPHTLHATDLDLWLGATLPPVVVPEGMWGVGVSDPDLWGRSFIEDFRLRPDNGCDWIAYYGAFPTDR